MHSCLGTPNTSCQTIFLHPTKFTLHEVFRISPIPSLVLFTKDFVVVNCLKVNNMKLFQNINGNFEWKEETFVRKIVEIYDEFFITRVDSEIFKHPWYPWNSIFSIKINLIFISMNGFMDSHISEIQYLWNLNTWFLCTYCYVIYKIHFHTNPVKCFIYDTSEGLSFPEVEILFSNFFK